MADDSDVDSWDLKQDEFVQPPYKNRPTPPPASKFDIPDTLASRSGSQPSANGYSALHRYDRPTQRSPRSGSGVRFINPAIYAESLAPSANHRENSTSAITTDDEARIIVNVRCGDSSDLAEGLSALSVNEDSPRSGGAGDVAGYLSDLAAADTYRCSRSDTSRSSTLTLTNNSKSVTRLIKRCVMNSRTGGEDETYGETVREDVKRFTLNGRRVVQFSSTSLSSSAISEGRSTSGLVLARKIAHEEWVQKKQREALRKSEAERMSELRRQAEEDELEKERCERERRERENFLRWQERKKMEEANRRMTVERELELQRRLKAVEDHASVAKVIHLRQWARKKEDVQKAQQKEQQLKRKAIVEEKRKRLEESSRAFEKWRESAKSRPRPATQGLLPHQRAKPAYVNPKPWQQIVEDDEAEPKPDLSSKKVMGQPKSTVRKSITSRH